VSPEESGPEESGPEESGMEIRVLRPGDDGLVTAASHLFDGPARHDATARFLAEEGHHLLIAFEDGRAVGFVSGVEVTHPDKGTEMFLYELAVDEPFRRRGIGRALTERLAALARQAGCYGMWVLTDEDNEAARATYEGAGGVPESGQVVEVWTFS
jgi:ribosomal protein S18 acetylase RimI-like enzyme